jgi:hypothetical protein
MLEIDSLILWRIRHFEGKAIDQQRLAFFPAPSLILGPLDKRCDAMRITSSRICRWLELDT